MPFEYVNRRGDRYYLFQGKTKTGKPKYYVSRKPGGVPVDQVPDGFEIYERPERGLVSLRKTRSSNVTPDEREQVTHWTRELACIDHFFVDVKGDSLVIYTPSTDLADSFGRLADRFGLSPRTLADERDRVARSAHYTAMMRFKLVDKTKRLFSAERWCFRGSIDRWWSLDYGKPLETLAREYLPHLDSASFYELM